ncbi:unnamed protein product [Pseudo-nitzschia multistriata]|uniref:V-SNARE coiled-coil homology domain-containing protein n=1 Tax=Pseudo-nitzschia multistriata TaxID=183589 RepID=A0A448ZK40_9STRA|nr:unnamed protein product [Pseudo-nitzschia multistriata]
MKKFGLRKLLKSSSSDVADTENRSSSETAESNGLDESSPVDKLCSNNLVENEEEHRKQLFGFIGKKKKVRGGERKDGEETIKSKTANDDGEEEENENDNGEEDVHKLLEEMDIIDFNMSMSLDYDVEDKVGVTETSNQNRLEREEVFSQRYHPSKLETKELKELAQRLGVNSSSMRLTACQKNLHELLYGNHSIILKQGPISFNYQNCDLILLTDGFVSAYQNYNIYNPLEGRYETCQLWSDVKFVELPNFGTLKIQMSSGESFEIRCPSDGADLKRWLKAIEHVAILSTMHSSDPPSMVTDQLGWQYILIRKPAYTAAVTGDMKLMGNPENLNELDEYNRSSPLHYAIQAEPCNVDMVDALLRGGADPNLVDGEGRSAMYYAQRNKSLDIEQMLINCGGKKSQLIETELRGELFGGVDQAAKNTEKRREIEQAVKDNKAAEAAAKVQSAQSQMSQNMAAMAERGEKIKAMDDKAQQLNDEAREYGNLASQLNNHMKNKKWYQF